ncbi:MAG TPA: hypothetical protein PK156_45090, partial [Polyangium sp.]|nr:hypothetical protein [Polyangium sp.]
RTVHKQDGGSIVFLGGAHYAHNGSPVWASGTDGHPGAYLIMQDDGNVVIYSTEGRALWSTNTWL